MTNPDPTDPALNLTSDFWWSEVPPIRDLTTAAAPVEPEIARASVKAAPPDTPPLGDISGFSGTFVGTGFNTIFRPQNANSPTVLLNPPHGPDDNVLELNLTTETLAFSDPIGSIPNRGAVQGDIFFNGVPYVQKIKDVNDPAHPVDIHFEPGIWLNVPTTTVPGETGTLVRMASIPHGTTIEAQGTSFHSPDGRPRIDPVDITPFPIGGDQNTFSIPFPSQQVDDVNTFRIPQDLTPFIAAGSITRDILKDPNLVIKNRADKQQFTDTIVIIISTDPTDPLFGGGTDNIAFLRGDRNAANPNADAVRMSAIFWLETVEHQITVPASYTPGQTLTVDATDDHGDLVPAFAISSTSPLEAGRVIDVTYPQIQYTQTVLLNFKTLSWPHVSVATLVPATPVPVSVP